MCAVRLATKESTCPASLHYAGPAVCIGLKSLMVVMNDIPRAVDGKQCRCDLCSLLL